MSVLIAVIFAGLFGAIIGSFLTVVVARVPARESIVSPGSACPHCGTPVAWHHNVPVVSWLLLRGRCAHCGVAISIRYPALELGTGLVFAVIVAVVGVEPELALALPAAALFIAVGLIDAEHHIVPNPMVIAGAVIALLAGTIADVGGEPERLAAGAGAFVVFLIIALISPGGMGMGDVKLAGVMGLFLGIEVIPALLIAFLAGSLVGGVVMARGGLEKRKSGLPFAPFLALGGLLALVVGPDLVDLYRDHLL